MTVVASFPLLEEPPPPEPVLGAGGPQALASLEERSLFGYGLLTPFRRDRSGDFRASGGEALVRGAIEQVLFTRADDGNLGGELPWRPEFGSLLHRLQFLPIDESFATLARSRIVSALSQWEPRCRINRCTVERALDARGQVVAFLRVNYTLVQSATQNALTKNLDLDVPLPR